MEKFSDHEEKTKIKEKNVYLLHLDTPRIIIISSIFVGVIIITLLIGMKINKNTNNEYDFTQEENIFDNVISENKLKKDVFNTKPITLSMDDEKILNYKSDQNTYPIIKNNRKKSEVLNNEYKIEEKEKDTGDIITSENIRDILVPKKEVKEVKEVTRVKPKRLIKKKPQKKKVQIKKRNKKKQRVIEVSSKRKTINPSQSNINHYSIQVVSYDNKSKAKSEVNTLEKMRYNAYVNKAKVRGKIFFRVRIGPVFSKRKALNLLNEINEIDRYEESYMVKE